MTASFSIAGVSFSLSDPPESLAAWKQQLFDEISALRKQGASLIVFPELFLMGLSAYCESSSPEGELQAVAACIERELLPEIKAAFAAPDFCLVLGSGPRQKGTRIFNTAFILCEEQWIFQDKIHLTPWETEFTPGEELQLFSFRGLRTALLICFDIEHPGLSLLLKNEGLELLLVPSATSDLNGNQRVNRCASARSIELGAAVLTVPLIGAGKSELVDHSEGRQGFFLPAQAAFATPVLQESFSAYASRETVRASFVCPAQRLQELKQPSSETKPFLSAESRAINLKNLSRS